MGTPGFTPIDEPSTPKGFTPIEEPSAVSTSSASGFYIPSVGLGYNKAIVPQEPAASWTEYPKEIAQGIGRGAKNIVTGVGEAMKPRDPSEVKWGPTGRLIGHVIGDTATGLETAAKAGAEAYGRGEGLGSSVLTGMENLPFVGGAVQHAEQGGPKMFSPQAFGATAELGTYAVAPKVTSRLVQGAVDLPSEINAFTRRATSMNEVTKAAAGVYQREVQPPIQKLQAAVKEEAARTIQQVIEADKASGEANISGAPVLAEVTKAMEETGHNPTTGTQALLNRLRSADQVNPLVDQTARAYYKKTWGDLTPSQQADLGRMLPEDIRPKADGGGLSLEDAKNLRSDIGAAASKAKDARTAKVLWTAYNELGNGMASRIEELTGSRKPFDHYNNEFKAYYELNKGVTGSMQDGIADRHDAVPKLREFATADVTEIKDMMKKYGLRPEELDRAQKSAKAVTAAFDSVGGKFNRSLYRVVLSGGTTSAGAALAIYLVARGAGLYGLAPLLLSTFVASRVAGEEPRIETGTILRRLGVDPEAFQVRTPVEGPTSEIPMAPRLSLRERIAQVKENFGERIGKMEFKVPERARKRASLMGGGAGAGIAIEGTKQDKARDIENARGMR